MPEIIPAPKSITILSLGAGVQSTALALMAEAGIIDKPVAAIFSDTGDESPKLYAHVEWIRSKVSFPIHIVKEGNGLGLDFLDALAGKKNRASQPPFHVKAPTLTPAEIEAILTEPEPLKPPVITAGQAWEITTAFLSDTEADLFGVRTEAEELLATEWNAWKLRRQQALNTDQGGMLWRACTRDYKIIPIRRKVREIMLEHGAKHVFQQIGISTDERQREAASGVKFITNTHPLLQLGWNRFKVETWLWETFGLKVPKSACHYCPYRSNAGWRWMRDNDPDEFEKACLYDEAIREAQGKKIRGAGIVGQLYVHRSFVPLRIADLRESPGQLDFGFEQECQGMCGY
jgi:hypothetical protein